MGTGRAGARKWRFGNERISVLRVRYAGDEGDLKSIRGIAFDFLDTKTKRLFLFSESVTSFRDFFLSLFLLFSVVEMGKGLELLACNLGLQAIAVFWEFLTPAYFRVPRKRQDVW